MTCSKIIVLTICRNIEIIGLITARGGSKGIPGKNIKPLVGKPLIAWTIQAALESSVLDRVIVSTNDDKIAQISREYGAEVPFIRPKRLANDDSPHIDTIIHAINWLKTHDNYFPEYIMLLQPTSPLRTNEDIDKVIDLAIGKDADGIVSVSVSPTHPYKVKQIDKNGRLIDFVDTPKGYLPRQSLPVAYFENGAIYLTKTEIILKQRTFYPECTFPYIMPFERSLDIDTPWDFYLGNLVLQDKFIREDPKNKLYQENQK